MRPWLLLLPLLVAGTAGAAPEAGNLTYYTGEPPGTVFPHLHFLGQTIYVTAAPPAKLVLPRCASKKPLYGTADLGSAGRTPLMLLDESHGTGTGYDTVYVDANLNRDFTDEKPAPRSKTPGYVPGTPFWLPVPFAGRRVPYHAVLKKPAYTRSRSEKGPPRPAMAARGPGERYYLEAQGYYAGTLLFGHRLRRVALIDVDVNGRFNDLDMRAMFRSDRLLVDLNNNGQFDGARHEQIGYSDGDEVLFPGKRVFVDGQYWDLSVRPDGCAIHAVPTRAKLGLLKSDTPQVHLALADSGSILLTQTSDGQVRVPVGKYRIVVWAVRWPDGKGGMWRVYGGKWGGTIERREIKVMPTGAAWLKLGGASLVSEVYAFTGPRYPPPGSVLFGIVLHTPTCHVVNNLRPIRRSAAGGVQSAPVPGRPGAPGPGARGARGTPGPGRPPAPDTWSALFAGHPWPIAHIRIADERGASVADVRCNSRSDNSMWCGTWQVPPRLRGKKLKAITHFEGWPLNVKPKSCTFIVKSATPKAPKPRAPAR